MTNTLGVVILPAVTTRQGEQVATLSPYKEHYDADIRGLAGKTIKRVRHMTTAEIESFAWYESPEDTILIEFTDDTVAIVSADPEGNGAGFLFTGQYK